MKIADTQLDEIEQIAKKAHQELGDYWGTEMTFHLDGWGESCASYLASMDPATTLALVAEVRRARIYLNATTIQCDVMIAEVKKQHAAIERARTVHESEDIGEIPGYGMERRCLGCNNHWPCDTIRALDEVTS